MKYNKEILDRFLTEKVAIAVRAQEEWDEFMELLESETDLRWEHTEFDIWKKCKEETSIIEGYFNDGTISYDSCAYHEKLGYKIVEFKELVKEEMNLADKLRFLADRWEDGKDFCIDGVTYSLNKGELVMLPSGVQSEIEINDLKRLNLRLAPQWTFTEDEKAILRNLPEDYKWIARDKSVNKLYVYTSKPTKETRSWLSGTGNICYLEVYGHLFKNIQWTDKEPCEFRKYL